MRLSGDEGRRSTHSVNPGCAAAPGAHNRAIEQAMSRTAVPRSAIVGWLLFDWACQPFFTLVTTFIFAPYFASALAADPVTGQTQWGYATAAAGLLIAGLSPVLGAIADASGPKKPWIAGAGLVLVIASTTLWWAAPGAPWR